MGYTPRNEKCCTCGRTFLKKAPRSVRCPECQRIQKQREKNARALKRHHEKASKEKLARKSGKHQGLCNVKLCKSCMYRGRDTSLGNENGIYCNYMSVTGKSRSSICPAGACTVYEKGSPRKKTEGITLIEE